MHPNEETTIALPKSLALFPLSKVVIMPYAHLPLNIFEDRYKNMVVDSFDSGHFIGIVQPETDHADPVPGDAKLYRTGTLARIFSFVDPGDGTYQITLQGLIRFDIKSETTNERGYRVGDVDYEKYSSDLVPNSAQDGPARGQLVEMMHTYLKGREIDVDWEAVNSAPYAALVSSLVMTCPFGSGEKQALLEMTDDQKRADMMLQLFEMARSAPDGTASSSRH